MASNVQTILPDAAAQITAPSLRGTASQYMKMAEIQATLPDVPAARVPCEAIDRTFKSTTVGEYKTAPSFRFPIRTATCVTISSP